MKPHIKRYCIQMTINNNETKRVSLCIPRVDKNTTDRDVKSIIEKLSIGDIDRIDMVPNKNNNDSSNRAFIHLRNWVSSDRTNKIYEMLTTGKNIKVVYNDPWFWKISLSRNQPTTSWN